MEPCEVLEGKPHGDSLWGVGLARPGKVAPEWGVLATRWGSMSSGGLAVPSLHCLAPPHHGAWPLSRPMTNSGLLGASQGCQVFGFRLFSAWTRMLGFVGMVGEQTPSQTAGEGGGRLRV